MQRTEDRCKNSLESCIRSELDKSGTEFSVPVWNDETHGKPHKHGYSVGFSTYEGEYCDGVTLFPTLYDALKNVKTKTSLYCLRLTLEQAEGLIRLLKVNDAFTKLIFRETEPGVVNYVTRSLKKLKHIKSLALRSVFTQEDQDILLKNAEQLDLTSISLDSWRCTKVNTNLLCNLLKSNKNLISLDLGGEILTSEAMKEFAENINDSSITSLKLRDCRFPKIEDAHPLTQALRTNTKITKLNLRWFSNGKKSMENMSLELARVFLDAIKDNHTLTEVHIHFEEDHAEELNKELNEYLERNKNPKPDYKSPKP